MATQNTDLKEAKKDAIMTPDMYRSMFLRQFTSQCSQSYDKMMAMGFMYTIQKPLRKIYPNDDDYYAALDRHTEFFNITPHVLPFVAGLTVSMEEQAAADKNFDTSSMISGVVPVRVEKTQTESLLKVLGGHARNSASSARWLLPGWAG